LDLQEIREMNEDQTAVARSELKKLPDFEQLKKDAEIQNLKVVSFFKVRYIIYFLDRDVI
jgi:hypothetical protein